MPGWTLPAPPLWKAEAMSDDPTWPDGDPSRQQPQPPHQPNWGSAYPPPTPESGFAPPHGYYPYGPPPKHQNATTAMVLGIVGLAGGFICWLPIVMAPFAWYLGAKAEKEIDASRGTVSGRGEATAGKVLGIIGTVLLVLSVVAIIAFIVLAVTVDDFWDDGYDTYSVIGALRATLSAGR